MFSKRTNWNFSENKLSRLCSFLKRGGVPIIDLSESNPTHCNFKYLTDAKLLAPLPQPANLNYNPSPKGKKEARDAIRSYYRNQQIEINSERIFLTASTSEAYHSIFRLITNPNDRILIPRPSYPLFNFIADLNDVALDHYGIRYEHEKWQINFRESAGSLDSDTKAIIVVHPNNPTGSFLKTHEAEELIQTAKSKSLALISDEVFSDYGFCEDANRMTSLANTKEVLTFTLGGISKCLGLPQMKLSWIILSGPEKTVDQAAERLEIISDTYLSVNTPSQEALPYWFSCKDQIQNEIKERTAANRSWLSRKLLHNKSGISCLEPEGGWYAILKLPNSKNEEEWAFEFLEQEHVFVHPGYFFDFSEETYVVVSLLSECPRFQEGCERIVNHISACHSAPQGLS